MPRSLIFRAHALSLDISPQYYGIYGGGSDYAWMLDLSHILTLFVCCDFDISIHILDYKYSIGHIQL